VWRHWLANYWGSSARTARHQRLKATPKRRTGCRNDSPRAAVAFGDQVVWSDPVPHFRKREIVVYFRETSTPEGVAVDLFVLSCRATSKYGFFNNSFYFSGKPYIEREVLPRACQSADS
jgi:hypothetical protein